ncbi:MAG TPA: antibiotic biosynthesis monooxygenase [Terriglobales bacterium]|jgi:hypothetical protein
MIARVWHGYTTAENADTYERLLKSDILPSIEQSHPLGAHLLRRNLLEQNEVEFITICYFANLQEVRTFAGKDYEQCVVPDKARKLLKRFDQRSQHYEIRHEPRSQ